MYLTKSNWKYDCCRLTSVASWASHSLILTAPSFRYNWGREQVELIWRERFTSEVKGKNKGKKVRQSHTDSYEQANAQTYLPSWISPFLQFLFLSIVFYSMEYPFGWFGSAVLVESPPNFLHTPTLLDGETALEKTRTSWHRTSTAQQ